MAQNLDSLWVKIHQEFDNGNLKSVQPLVTEATQRARAEKNLPLLAKGLFYSGQITVVTSDETDDITPVFESFKKEIEASSSVGKAVLQVYLARLYDIYFNENRYRVQNRTDLETPSSDDVRFWTESDFKIRIMDVYMHVFFQKDALLKEDISEWKSLVVKDDQQDKKLELTPTLYDLFVHYAKERLFEPNIYLEELVKLNLAKKQYNAYLYNAYLLLPTGDKDEDLQKLETLAKEYPKAWYSGELYKELVKRYFERQNSIDKLTDYNKIFELQKTISALYPDSEVLKQVNSTVEAIKSTSIQAQIDQFILPNKNTPIQISHRNLQTAYIRVLNYDVGQKDPTSQELHTVFSTWHNNAKERYETFLKNHKTVQEYAIPFNKFEDYQEHSSIFNLKPLPSGRYVVLISQDPTFSYTNDKDLSYLEVKVSQFSVDYNNNAFLLTDRQTGKPQAQKTIEIFTMERNSNKYTLAKSLLTDSKGLAKIESGLRFIYRLKGEQFFYGSGIYSYKEPNYEDRSHTSTKIFTDRAIYRLGQTVYFKGIVTQTSSNSVVVLAKKDVEITLHDVNNKELSRLKLKTNEFGSVHGEFVLPQSALTGHFSIRTNLSGHYSFRVEEYKRPKFSVEIEKPKGVFTLNDSIRVQGAAIAFSGANIDGAKVEYRVSRRAIYPYRMWGYRPPYEPDQEIAFGTAITDKDGKFTLNFKAIPAREKKDEKDIRTYTYHVNVDVTDLNGETQSGSQSVSVGDKSVLLSTTLKNRSHVSSLGSFSVKVNNLNQQAIDHNGTLEIFALKSPNRPLRKSNFVSDYQFYSKAEFVKLFPNEPYGDEAKPENWERGKSIYKASFQKTTDLSVSQTDKLDEGYYWVSLRTEDGLETGELLYFINEKRNSKTKEIFTHNLDKTEYKPGEVAKISLNTGADELFVTVRVESNQKLIRTEVIQLKGKEKTLEIPIKEEHRGNIHVHYYWVKYNTKEQGTIHIQVPYNHKKLDVSTAVTRDKLAPGSKETWSFKVSDSNKDKVLAEFLTGMYDASLDQFASNSFSHFVYDFYSFAKHGFGYTEYAFTKNTSNAILSGAKHPNYFGSLQHLLLMDHNFTFNTYRNQYRRNSRVDRVFPQSAPAAMMSDASALEEVVVTGYGGQQKKSMVAQEKFFPPELKESAAAGGAASDTISTEEKDSALNNVQARKALQETAFFYPNLRTDKDGNVSFDFTVPESLTEWKLMAFAHTPDMKTGYYETRVKTQKDLMVVPNVPRFLREGDELRISNKIVNLSEQSLNGTARLVLTDAISGNEVNSLFANTKTDKNFTTAKGESGEVSWTIKVPKNIQAVSYKIVAAAGDFSDGEESILPVVTNRMLVTETLPISIRENQNKTFTFDKLTKNTSETLDNFKLTFEMTTNPLWYAIFSLPYLREYPYECSEQVFSRLYGNLISENIIGSQPKIKAVFDDWNRKGQLKSKLELNQELKNILLEETPWVRDAVSEEEQMKRIAVLFDLNKMQQEMKAAFDKLSQKQQNSGGFAWFDGGRENEYITTHIVSGFGNLKNMKIDLKKHGIEINSLVKNAINFIDQKQLEYYKEQQRLKKNDLDWNTGIHYLYARSFFLQEHAMPKTLDSLKLIYLNNIKKNAKDFSLQTQAMAALVLSRFGEKPAAEKLLKTVNEHSVDSDEMGKYWKSNQSGWYWYQAPVETQALLIEAFHEVLKDETSVEAMKVWLLKNRQTNQWNSTKATTKAVYALMNTGKSWIDAEKGVSVKIGGQSIDLNTPSAQAGSGYVKMAWNKDEIKPEMGKVEVQKTSPGVAWGAMYWQYFEELDKITSAETGVKFNKKLYLKKNSPTGPVLREITPTTPIEIGDLVTVRLEISIDRNMEFVHIKDMRASGFEPVNVLSGYKWKDGFGYYESTRDLATNFFADYMRKGTYVFEYDLRANNAGNFSNGITQMQNMYAPELSAHSEGIRVEIRD